MIEAVYQLLLVSTSDVHSSVQSHPLSQMLMTGYIPSLSPPLVSSFKSGRSVYVPGGMHGYVWSQCKKAPSTSCISQCVADVFWEHHVNCRGNESYVHLRKPFHYIPFSAAHSVALAPWKEIEVPSLITESSCHPCRQASCYQQPRPCPDLQVREDRKLVSHNWSQSSW